MYIPQNKKHFGSWYREQVDVYAANVEAARTKCKSLGKITYVQEETA